MSNLFEFSDEAKLLSRLTRALVKRPREVIFLIGSPLSAPTAPGSPGVPNVAGIIKMIREEFEDDAQEVAQFDAVLDQAGEKTYQASFNFLQATRGQDVANEIVRKAVLAACTRKLDEVPVNDDELYRIEMDGDSWHLNSGTESIGKLISHYPDLFGKALLTTNFDPLIEIAIKRAGGELFRTTLHLDGSLQQTYGSGCHTIHLHGYWWGSDTLHTTRQLVQERPRLKASLKNLLKDKLVLVCGYGGWDDVFTSTLLDIVQDDSSGTEVLWTFFGDQPYIHDDLGSQLSPGLNRGRVLLYKNIDGNSLFAKLYSSWQTLRSEALPIPGRSNPVQISAAFQESVELEAVPATMIEGDDEDRPPLVDLCIGRETELDELLRSNAKIVFLTGIGGQGKSTIASRYFSEALRDHRFEYLVWRDCKEESERFENQIASIIESLSGGVLRSADLAKLNIKSLIDILLPRLVGDMKALFVFDNLDHYVNLDSGLLTGSADLFAHAILNSDTRCQIVFTCRPVVDYQNHDSLSIRLEGLSLEATRELFAMRGANVAISEIESAHELTNGHAFWLDLLALQTIRGSSAKSLGDLVEEIRSGAGELPTATLSSIWGKLHDRDQIVLRAMAETVRPETEIELGSYLSAQLNYNKFSKALKALRALNLIVVKRTKAGGELLELHPLVRQFVRGRFSRTERATVISFIMQVYQRAMGIYKPQLGSRPSLGVLQRWTQAAELDIAAGHFAEAIAVLREVSKAFEASAFFREYVRVVRLLLSSFDWNREGKKFLHFDVVFDSHVSCLAHLGEFAEAEILLSQYGKGLERDARYIRFCEMQCTVKWIRGDLADAVAWGRKGRDLLKSSGVDTKSNVEHALALAERDAGSPDLALPFFLQSRSIEDVLNAGELDENRGGHHYGNIGRCLQLAGQVGSALVCYQKSALLIEKDKEIEHILNQGYIRMWIGELLLSKKELEMGSVFLEASRLKWEKISPHKARQVAKIQEQMDPAVLQLGRRGEVEVEKICKNWIFGK